MLVIDENLPISLARHLQHRGFSALHVRELDLSRTPDQAIWRSAIDEDWTIVTKDSDFIDLALFTQGAKLIHLRIGNCSTGDLKAVIDRNLARISQFVISDGRILIITA